MKNLIARIKRINIIVLLVGVIVVLVILNMLFSRPGNNNQNNNEVGIGINGSTQPNFDYPPESDSDALSLGETDQNILWNVIDVMPFHSDSFSVTYDYGHDEFTVYLNPASGATEEDVRKWFATFKDVKDPNKLRIEFPDPYASGAPTSIN